MRNIKQMGVDYVLMGGPQIPWKVEDLRTVMDKYKANGLTVINMMIGGHSNAIYGREGRDEEIAKIKESIVAAGAAVCRLLNITGMLTGSWKVTTIKKDVGVQVLQPTIMPL